MVHREDPPVREQCLELEVVRVAGAIVQTREEIRALRSHVIVAMGQTCLEDAPLPMALVRMVRVGAKDDDKAEANRRQGAPGAPEIDPDREGVALPQEK